MKVLAVRKQVAGAVAVLSIAATLIGASNSAAATSASGGQSVTGIPEIASQGFMPQPVSFGEATIGESTSPEQGFQVAANRPWQLSISSNQVGSSEAGSMSWQLTSLGRKTVDAPVFALPGAVNPAVVASGSGAPGAADTAVGLTFHRSLNYDEALQAPADGSPAPQITYTVSLAY